MACSRSYFSTVLEVEKKHSKQKLEVVYCSKDPEILIDPYIMNESKFKIDIVALLPFVKFGLIHISASLTCQASLQTKDELPTSA